MLCSAGANPLALRNQDNKSSDDRPPCLENPRPNGAESTLTENASSPFQAEPRHKDMNDSQRFELAMSQVFGKRLTYAELTGKGTDSLHHEATGARETQVPF